MTTATRNAVRKLTIDLQQGDTPLPDCHTLPEREYRDSYYTHTPHPLAIVELPDDPDEYERHTCSKVVRENARFCERLGYRYQRIDRADWADDLYAIRSSAEHRQGRRMPAAYLTFQEYGHDFEPECERHGITVHGVIGNDGHLAAYTQMVQCGDVARVNTILGHADKNQDRVMWLLMLRTFQFHIGTRARYGLYFTHASGHGDGLRYWKERFGMRPTRVTWGFV